MAITTLDGIFIKRVSSYKYLWIYRKDERLAFDVHIDNLLKKLRPKLVVFYRLRTFLRGSRENSRVHFLVKKSKLDSVYHAALRLVCGAE